MEEVMKILFLGGDKRYKFMIEKLKNIYEIHQIGFKFSDNKIYEEDLENLDLSNFDIVLFPISGLNDELEIKTELGLLKLSDTLFSDIEEKTTFFTGLKTKKILEFIPQRQIISFLDYEEVKNVNDSLTIDRSY